MRYLVVDGILLGLCLASGDAGDKAYRSPYTVKFTFPTSELLADIEHGTRGELRELSSVPVGDWYSKRIRERFGAWGPPARHFPAAHAVAGRPLPWQRERVVALGLRYQGYGYQHHHLPDWNPPAGWPWKETAVGHNGKGVDCSNFTALVYNLGFGLKPSSDVHKQAEHLDIDGPGPARSSRATRLELPKSYRELIDTLHTGDLLYIRNRAGALAHVVIWVGAIGHTPDGKPLILDSHGEGVKDSSGVSIPAGVQLRPFGEKSWYFHSASHAHRLIHGP